MDANLKDLSVVLFFQLLCVQSVKITNADYNKLVYKNCANRTFSGGNSQSQALHSLFQELISQSSQSKFFKATAGEDYNGISGFYQCRGDLSNSECYNCVNKLPELSKTLCRESVLARIQLHGCYIHYEADGVVIDDDDDDESRPKHEVLQKSCGKPIEELIIGFQEMRDAALVAVESGVVTENGFCAIDYELVHAMAQCEGDLVGCDCSECVSNAVQILEQECGNSDSGQLYLDKCFVSYTYYPHGLPGKPFQRNGDGNGNGNGNGNGTGKTLAIVLGGGAALAFVFIFLMCIRSMRRKDDDY